MITKRALIRELRQMRRVVPPAGPRETGPRQRFNTYNYYASIVFALEIEEISPGMPELTPFCSHDLKR